MTTPETAAGQAVRSTHLLGLDSCPLHRNTPFGMANVSMTQLSIARHYGGIKFNGDHYTYFADTDELVRDDVLKWQRKQKRAKPNGGTEARRVAVASGALLAVPNGCDK